MTTDATDDVSPPDLYSRIAAVVFADAPAHLDADAVEAVLDVTFDSVDRACLLADPPDDFYGGEVFRA